MFRFREGFYSDVRIEERFTTSIRYRDGILEENRSTSVKKAFIRVFDGEMWYYASTYKTDDLQAELDRLCESATPNPDIANHPTVKKFEVNREDAVKFSDCSVKNVSAEEKQRALAQAEGALASSEYVKMRVAIYADRYSSYEFYSSKGAHIRYDWQICGVASQVALARGEDNFTDFTQSVSDRFDGLDFSCERGKAFVAEAENFLLNAKSVEPGVYPVILSPQVAGVFAHESFGHKSEADFMIGDETMKKEWALGKKVGADVLSIYDSGLEAGSGYAPFDDEGTRARKTYLIKNGVLTGRLHSASTASELSEELTGNARAINCEFEPIVRMTSTVIEAGILSEEELFSKIKHGYFIKTYKHGSGMSTFTIAPSLAYEIVDGKIGDPVKIAVISGNVFETLNLIDGLSAHAKIVSSAFGGCGKMEQFPLSVSDGGPYVSVSKMNVQ